MDDVSVIVISHRRSGTHLTVDAILNNFDHFSKNTNVTSFTLDHIFNAKREGYDRDLQKLVRSMESKPKVLKTHSLSNVQAYFKSLEEDELSDLVEIFESYKKIYVYRGGLDVITSLYHYQKQYKPSLKNVSFSEFLRQPNDLDPFVSSESVSRPKFWAQHLEGWLGLQGTVLPIKFDEMAKEPEETIKKIAKYIGVERSSDLKDVCMSGGQGDELSDTIARTSISFRKGTVGDWKNHFSESDVRYFEDEVAQVSESLLSYLE